MQLSFPALSNSGFQGKNVLSGLPSLRISSSLFVRQTPRGPPLMVTCMVMSPPYHPKHLAMALRAVACTWRAKCSTMRATPTASSWSQGAPEAWLSQRSARSGEPVCCARGWGPHASPLDFCTSASLPVPICLLCLGNEDALLREGGHHGSCLAPRAQLRAARAMLS